MTHRLVEGFRTAEGPRQRIVMHLGTLDLPKSEWKKLASALELRLSGQVSLFEEDSAIAEAADKAMAHYDFKAIQKSDRDLLQDKQEMVLVDINSVVTMDVRQLGPELVGHHIWQQLNLNEILTDCGLNNRQIALAEAVVVARLVEPASELATWQWIRNRTALIELLDADISKIDKDSVYEIADTLLAHKNKLERALREKERTLFPEDITLFLYDLTNTYFEGSCQKNELAKRGKSKEKRSDCPLVTLAMVVDSRGFPIFSQIYHGNQSEPATLAVILEKLLLDSAGIFTSFLPTIVMDRGIATHANLELLKTMSYPYVVVERRATEKDYVEEFAKARDTFEVLSQTDDPNSSKVYVKKIEAEDAVRILCLSEGREEKEQAMDRLKEQRFVNDITRLRNSVTKRNVIKLNKVSERIGRIKERYPSIAHYYDINLILDEAKPEVLDINWIKKESREERSTLTGAYVIESSHNHLNAQEIWKIYTTLTQVEYSFRCLKTDLGFRPVYHHIARRTEGHLFISVLAYHLLICIETQLKEQGDIRKWSTIRKVLSTYQRSTVVMTNQEGHIHHIRVSCLQEPAHKDIFRKLNIKDPTKRMHRLMQQNRK